MKSLYLFIYLCLLQLIFAREYVVGVEDLDYYPYYKVEAGEYVGFARDLFDMFHEKTGIELEYRVLPIDRLYFEQKNKKIDFKFPDNPLWGNEKLDKDKVVYSDPVVEYIDGIVVRDFNFGKELNELRTIGIVRGFDSTEVIDYIKFNTDIEIVFLDNTKSMVLKLYSNRVDAIYANVSVLLTIKEELQLEKNIVFADNLPYTANDYYMSTNIEENLEVLEEFNKFMLEYSNEVEELKKNYGLID